MSVKGKCSRLEYFYINSVKPKNSIWKKIKKIMPQKNCEEAWSCIILFVEKYSKSRTLQVTELML